MMEAAFSPCKFGSPEGAHDYDFTQFLTGGQPALVYGLLYCRRCGQMYVLGADDQLHAIALGVTWEAYKNEHPHGGPHLTFSR